MAKLINDERRREWLRGWERASRVMEELRDDDLRSRSQAESVRIFNGFDSSFPPVLRESSGLVDQQRYFRKLHRRGGR